MKVAVVGAGIAGIAAAHALQDHAEVTVFEAARRIGGHTDTHAILAGGRTYRVDSGFIVFNAHNYPRFSAWLEELGVGARATDMSFAVSNRNSGLEYGTRNLNALLCRRRNLVSPGFIGMLADLRRFYREAGAVPGDDGRTLGQYLDQEGYGEAFARAHLVPMCAALWSLPTGDALTLPIAHVVAFMNQHRLLQVNGRPQWQVVEGGSASYLKAFARRFKGRLRTGDPVLRIARQPNSATVTSFSGVHDFDAVVLACHSDQALAALQDPSAAERDILGAIRYQRNLVVVHSDSSVMPLRRAAWSSWNAVVDDRLPGQCQVSYWMNLLQSLDRQQQFFVTLNPGVELQRVWSRRDYAHPVFTSHARLAQKRRDEINGVRNTYYCGAYWGWGFHEDAFASGVEVAEALLKGCARAA